MTFEDFCVAMKRIVDLGATPFFACPCGAATWMYEGSYKEAYKQMKCPRCELNRTLGADYNADL